MHVDVARPSDGKPSCSRKGCQRYRPEERVQREVEEREFSSEKRREAGEERAEKRRGGERAEAKRR